MSICEKISYSIENEQGRLVVKSSDGRVMPWSSYGASSCRTMETFIKMNESFIGSGVDVFQLAIWSVPGVFFHNPFSSLDGKSVKEPRKPMFFAEMAEWCIENNPNAHFIIRFPLQPDPQWRQEHLDHYQPLKKAKNPQDSFSVNPSLASPLFAEHTTTMIHDVIAWCEKQPWRNRIISYALFPLGEGTTEVSNAGSYFDRSEIMRQTFKTYIKNKYQTVEELQLAWNDSTASFDTSDVPTDEEWLNKKSNLQLMHWPDPALVQKEKDYFLLQKDLFKDFWNNAFDAMLDATEDRPVIKAYDMFKQHMHGWLNHPSFFGEWSPSTLDDYGNCYVVTGSMDVEKLLDHKGIDVLQTPAMYYNRAMGYTVEAEGLTNSMNLRGGLNWMEGDFRTWIDREWGGGIPERPPKYDAGTFMDMTEVSAGFDRQLAWAFSRNQMFYYMSVCGANWWFQDENIQGKIKECSKIIADSAQHPFEETSDAICIIIDDNSGIYEDFSAGFQHIAVYRQLEEGLALCGVPYRIYLLSDLKKDNFPNYKCFLFPNLFHVDDDTLKLLRKKVLCNGNIAIFGPGTGIHDGTKISADGAESIFEIPMEIMHKSVTRRVILQDFGHPISSRLQTSFFGESYCFGPTLMPKAQRLNEPGKVMQLGNTFYYYFTDRAGLFVRDFGLGAAGSGKPGKRLENDYSVVFSPAIPLPPDLLRECCRYAACNIWSEKNNAILANNSFLGIHTTSSGKQQFSLPGQYDVVNWQTNEVIAENTDSIQISTKAPQTVLLKLIRK